MAEEKFLEKQKNKLLKQKEELVAQLKTLRSTRKRGKRFFVRFPIYGQDVDSDIQEVQDYSDNLARERELSKLLRETNLALRLIKKKKYGICVVCKKPIPTLRLEAFPAALTHSTCKPPLRFWQKIWPFKKLKNLKNSKKKNPKTEKHKK